MIFNVLLVAESFWMIWLQLSLLRIQYYFRRNPRRKPLTTFEICFVAGMQWAIFSLGSSTVRFCVGVLIPKYEKKGGEGMQSYFGLEGWRSFMFKVVASFLFHWAMDVVLESTVAKLPPVTRSLSRDIWHEWEGVREKVEVVGKEVYELTRHVWFVVRQTIWNLPLDHISQEFKAHHQLIGLERQQSRDDVDGERILNWNIVVDEQALDEMKETLGPPGGFGEMGFSVSKEGVSFEAMGVGTRFNLRFVVMKGGKMEVLKVGRKEGKGRGAARKGHGTIRHTRSSSTLERILEP